MQFLFVRIFREVEIAYLLYVGVWGIAMLLNITDDTEDAVVILRESSVYDNS